MPGLEVAGSQGVQNTIDRAAVGQSDDAATEARAGEAGTRGAALLGERDEVVETSRTSLRIDRRTRVRGRVLPLQYVAKNGAPAVRYVLTCASVTPS